MKLLAVIKRRNQPPAKAAVTPGQGMSGREVLLRKISARRGGH